VSARLSDLRGEHLVTSRQRRAGRHPAGWSLTPLGDETVIDLLGDIDWHQIEPQLAEMPGAAFGSGRQTVLPPALAPAEWSAGIAQLLDRSPFENNVLCMTRFPREGRADDPNQAVIDTAREALAAHGLRLHLASERIVDEDLLGNVAAYIWACQYGLALFEDRVGEGLNHNLVIEVGAMTMAGRRLCLLRDTETVERMPTDLVGRIYKEANFAETGEVAREIHLWAAEDLGRGRCPECP
jgi:hypothetical protein